MDELLRNVKLRVVVSESEAPEISKSPTFSRADASAFVFPVLALTVLHCDRIIPHFAYHL